MKIIINGTEFECIGHSKISSIGNPESKQEKYFLENDQSLLVIPDENLAYIGANHGRLKEFDNFPNEVTFNEKKMTLANHDYQIELEKVFGLTEGECEFWDYECDDDNMFISVAVMTNGQRSDVVLTKVNFDDIQTKG